MNETGVKGEVLEEFPVTSRVFNTEVVLRSTEIQIEIPRSAGL